MYVIYGDVYDHVVGCKVPCLRAGAKLWVVVVASLCVSAMVVSAPSTFPIFVDCGVNLRMDYGTVEVARRLAEAAFNGLQVTPGLMPAI